MSEADEWVRSYSTIKSKHDEAYKTIELAIRNEETEHPKLALMNYKLGIALIDEALATPVALPDDPTELDETWQHACKIIHKMKRTRSEVLQRVSTLSAQYPVLTPVDEEISTADDPSTRPRTYNELAEALKNMKCNSLNEIDPLLEMVFTCDQTKLYSISANGNVTLTYESAVLRVLGLAEDVVKKVRKTYFLQVIGGQVDAEGSDNYDYWIYPLVAGASPCFYTDYGAFIFPDLQSEQIGSAIGIVVPAEIDKIMLEIFEALLHGVCRQSSDSLQRQRRGTSRVVSDNIVKGAYYISKGLIGGSQKVGQFVTYSTPYIISKLGQAPADAAPVSEGVVSGVGIAKSATSAAASVTGYVAGKVGSATMALGRFLAPHVQTQGSKLLSSAFNYNKEEAAEKVNDVLTIAAGAVEGFGTVYAGLEESAGILGSSLSNNSVKIIEHKYGPSAGSVALDAFDTVGNVINVSQNVNYITPKGFAKKAVKTTGKAIVDELRPANQNFHYVPAGSLYPDLSEFAKSVSSSTGGGQSKELI